MQEFFNLFSSNNLADTIASWVKFKLFSEAFFAIVAVPLVFYLIFKHFKDWF